MASLNVAVIEVVTATPVAPPVGVVLVTVGRVVSGAIVVNGQTLSEVLALPARSFMPVEPPLIVAVYDVEDASEDEGAN